MTILGLGLTPAANILSKEEPTGPQPHFSLLQRGIPRALAMIHQTRARVVLALTWDVFHSLRDALHFPDDKKRVVGDYKVRNRVLRPRWTIGLTTDGIEIVLAKTPNHPSRSSLWKDHVSQFGLDLAKVVHRQLGPQ